MSQTLQNSCLPSFGPVQSPGEHYPTRMKRLIILLFLFAGAGKEKEEDDEAFHAGGIMFAWTLDGTEGRQTGILQSLTHRGPDSIRYGPLRRYATHRLEIALKTRDLAFFHRGGFFPINPDPMPDLKLIEPQLTFFKTFGFLAFPGLLQDRIAEIIREFEAVFATRGGGHAGKPHAGKQRSCIVPFIDQNAILSSLLDDPRIHGIAASLLGDDFNFMPSDGNYYAGDTGWHSDGWHPETVHIKIAFYLDPLTRDTGCLRVVQGSHNGGDAF